MGYELLKCCVCEDDNVSVDWYCEDCHVYVCDNCREEHDRDRHQVDEPTEDERAALREP